jgi:hypothetical protein
MALARDANRSVCSVSSICAAPGVTVHTIVERASPPSEFCSSRVSLEERYGMWGAGEEEGGRSHSLDTT